MPMSPRLLRPRAGGGFHPDAQDWRNRVITNGGTVSGSTLTAVSNFCRSIDAAGIRSKFWRANLFCGDSDASLNAVRTPLYRGQSRTGTQYGNTTDTNVNLVQGDYAETGTGGGLNGGSTKYLATGLQPNAAGLSAFNTHMSIYSRAQITTNVSAIAGFGGGASNSTWQALTFAGLSLIYYRSGGANNCGIEAQAWSGANRAGHFVWVRSASNAAKMYRNGSDFGVTATTSNTDVWTTTDVAALFVFGRNNAGAADQLGFTGKMQGYTLGSALTDSEAAAYYTAMQTFQTALGRQL